MFAEVLSITDVLMWRWHTLLSFQSEAAIASLKTDMATGRNPNDAKVALAKEITARFHSAAAADAAEQDFINRSKGGLPDDIAEMSLPLGDGGSGGGVRVDSSVVSDKSLKLGAGVYVVQVDKRKFARVTLG